MRSLMRCVTVGVAAAAGAWALTAGMVTTAAAATAAAATTTAAAATVAGVEAPLPANAASDPDVSVNSVSCASAGNCTAVGSYTDSSGNLQGLLLTRAAGTWAGVEAPLPAGAASDPIVLANSVSCASAGNCTAVGRYTDSSGNQQGLLLTQTRGTWRAVKAPLPAGAAARPDVSVNSVSCASARTCTAVGSYADSSRNQQGLLLTRTAGTWRAVKAPLPAGAAAHSFVTLSSVSCASAGTCTAVGGYASSSGDILGLLLTRTTGTRTGGTWKAAKAPLPAGAAANPFVMLSSVSCASAGNCTAVGNYIGSSGSLLGLLLTRTGGTWRAVKAPLPAGAAARPDVSVNSVSCASARTCTAVGRYTGSSGNQQGLLLTWTGATWRAVKAPLPAGAAASPFAALSSVSCASARTCTAVGNYTDSSGGRQGLLVTQTSYYPPQHLR